MNNSEIFKKAHAEAKKIAHIVGDYMIAFSLSLKNIYARLKPSIESKLVAVGCRVWEKYGKKRIYINVDQMHAVFGLEVSFYGTGNISAASLNGEKISNSKARRLLSEKMYFDCITQEFVSPLKPII